MKRTNLFSTLILGFLVQVLAAQTPEPLKESAIAEGEKISPLINEISSTLWDYSETALKETQSAKYLIKKLKTAWFRIDEGVAEMPTAFVATYGKGSPVIDILAEYSPRLTKLMMK